MDFNKIDTFILGFMQITVYTCKLSINQHFEVIDYLGVICFSLYWLKTGNICITMITVITDISLS